MTKPVIRSGHGRWVATITPTPGILWANDDGQTGFQPAPGHNRDDMAALIAEHTTFDEAVDAIADAGNEAAGKLLRANIKTGDLTTWKEDPKT